MTQNDLAAALDAVNRLGGQKANSTPRRQTFTLTRDEVEALLAVRSVLRAARV